VNLGLGIKRLLVANSALGVALGLLGCNRTATPDYTPVEKTNNPPMANKEYTNQAVPTNQLQPVTNK